MLFEIISFLRRRYPKIVHVLNNVQLTIFYILITLSVLITYNENEMKNSLHRCEIYRPSFTHGHKYTK